MRWKLSEITGKFAVSFRFLSFPEAGIIDLGLINILLCSSFSSCQVLEVHRLIDEAFNWLCVEIERHFQQVKVRTGEMVSDGGATETHEA
jgi:hypothetical protein